MSQLHEKRHSLAHLLAASVKELYPGSHNAIGPSIDEGFYQDFEMSVKITDEDLPKIQAKMLELSKTWKAFEKKEATLEEALEIFKDNPYKCELAREFATEGKTLTIYTSGGFVDLCKGGHADSFSDIAPDSFKLDKIAGAYWRGDEKNKMLTRIYGLAFDSKEELEHYIWQQTEAVKRDHRKLGKELKLFTLSDLVGSGLPLFQPKGMIVRKELEDYLWDLHKDKGYSRVWTPHIAKEVLYETSGHAGHYMEDMFSVFGGTSKEKFYLKPMNCPHHMQVFDDNQFSYRDMPVRYFEPATVYRDEKTGQLSGLTRVRSITQDDGHQFCRVSGIHEEVSTVVEIIKKFYQTMGLIDGYRVRLSLRGEDKSNYLGSDEVWEQAEAALTKVCIEQNLPYFEGPGEAAFYGPKLDFMVKDAIGREWQLSTVQCDFNLPQRFNLSFVNEQGEKEQPVVIHRAIAGSLERFLGVAIEHFAGAFPVWMSPVQVAILPVSNEKHGEYATNVMNELKKAGVRVQLMTDETLGKRIREAKMTKIPYQIIIGDKEVESNTLTVEGRNDVKLEAISLSDFGEKIKQEIRERTLN